MKRGTPDHPKLLTFAATLKVPRYAAVGLLEMLWHFTAEFAPQGDIGKYSNERIASACAWIEVSARGSIIGGDHGRSDLLVAALVSCGWLDVYHTSPHGPLVVCQGCPDGPRMVVHGWGVHMPDYIKKSLAKKRLTVFESGLPNLTQPEPKPMTSTAQPAPPPPIGILVMADNFAMYLEACALAEMQGSETDLKAARSEWGRLALGDQLAACKGIKDRVASGELADPGFRPLPQNYLKNKTWQRTIREKHEPAVDKQKAHRNEVVGLMKIIGGLKT